MQLHGSSLLVGASQRHVRAHKDNHGIADLQQEAREVGDAAAKARQVYEETTELLVVSSENYKTLLQARQRDLQPPLFPDGDDNNPDSEDE